MKELIAKPVLTSLPSFVLFLNLGGNKQNTRNNMRLLIIINKIGDMIFTLCVNIDCFYLLIPHTKSRSVAPFV